MKYGLMFFASSEEALFGDKYSLLIESAKFADNHGFSSIWTPERHFTKYGSLYPNPAILNAALARETQHIRLQAGSVVLPIHHPIRIVEEWAVVDNLSHGRVGISFASGWNPNDFVFVPEKFANRHQELFDGLDVIKKLWQGELITTTNGQGNQIQIRTYPTPIQPELPIWITAASNPQTFIKAGEIGANILTHLLDQNIEELAAKITLYRKTRAKNGYDPEMGIVSIMLHTFVGEDFEQVQEEVRVPYCEYLKSNSGLLKSLAQGKGYSIDISSLSSKDLDDFVNFLFDRFASSRGLIGTPETCLDLLAQLDSIGVNEVACLLDFGPSKNLILSHLPYLNQLRENYSHQTVSKTKINISNIVLNSLPKTELTAPIGKTLAEIQQRCSNQINAQEYYQILEQKGLRLGGNFQGIENLWLGEREALAQIKLELTASSDHDLLTINPVVLEASHQVMGAILLDELLRKNELPFYLTVGFKSFKVYEPLKNQIWIQVNLNNSVNNSLNTVAPSIEEDVRIFDQDSKLLVEVSGLQIQDFAHLSQESQVQSQIHNTDWLYELQWQAKPLVKLESVREPGSWIIFSDRLGIGQNLAQLLEVQGETCFVVSSSQEKQIAQAGEILLDPADAQVMEKLIEQIGTRPNCRGIVHLWSLNTTPREETTIASLEQDWIVTLTSTINLVQALTRTNPSFLPQLWLVTQGVQKINLDDIPAITQAPIWGLGRSLAMEIPQLWGGLIDIDGEFSATDAAKELFAQIYEQDEESQIALRDGERFVARLVPSQKTTINIQNTLNLHSQATYVITGGLGYLGLNTARWMVEKGARNIVLVGRNKAGTNAQEAIAQLEHLGAHILVVQADISIQTDVMKIFEKIKAFYPPIKGIFHAAGVAEFQPLQNITPELIKSILAPKVLGTWNLHQMTLGMELDFFVCISSIASVWGSEGLANYAAASHFLDIFASYRQSFKLPALTVNVGALSGGGMHHHQDFTKAEKLLDQIGLKYYSPEKLLQNLELSLETKAQQQIIIDIDWSTFKPIYELRKRRTLLQEIEVHSPKPSPKLAASGEILQQLNQVSTNQQYELLINYLLAQISQVLKITNQLKLNPEKNLMELGIDSLMAMELRNNVQQNLGVEIPIITLIKGTTIANLATELTKLLRPQITDINQDNQIEVQDNNWIEGEL